MTIDQALCAAAPTPEGLRMASNAGEVSGVLVNYLVTKLRDDRLDVVISYVLTRMTDAGRAPGSLPLPNCGWRPV